MTISRTNKPGASLTRPLRENPIRLHVSRFYLATSLQTTLVLDPAEVQDADWFYPEDVLNSRDLELTTSTQAICRVLPKLATNQTLELIPTDYQLLYSTE